MGFQFRKPTWLQRKIQRKYKSKKMPGGKLSRLAGMKFNFHM